MTLSLEHSDETTGLESVPQKTDSPASRRLWWVGGLALVQAVVALDIEVPVVRPVLAIVTLVGLPTYLIARRADLPAVGPTARALYAFGVSLLGVVLVGLLLNTALPVVGVEEPLEPAVLAITWFVLDVGLLLWQDAPLPAPDVRAAVRRLAAARLELAQMLASVAVVLAVVGAFRLNNGAGGLVAIVAELAAAGAVLVLLVRRDEDEGRDARTLALVATALLLATSLRGWGITGHDIQAEFYAFRLTDSHHLWSMDLLQNAYNACLSVTILPTVLTQTTGLTGLVVFKLLLQLVFALVPVLTYLLAHRFLPRGLAVTAAAFTLAFPTFFTDMPYLVRQEVAFFFLGLLLLAATEPGRPEGIRRVFVVCFGVGVVLSHYSTTYLLLMGLIGGLVLLALWRLVSRRDDTARRPLVLLSPITIAALLAASLLWAGPATGTGGHAVKVARDTVSALVGKGVELPRSSDVSYWLFAGEDASPRERLNLFVDDTMDARKQAPASALLIRDPGPDELRPKIVAASAVPPTLLGSALESLGIDPAYVDTVARFGTAALLQLFLLTGVAAMAVTVWRRGRRKSASDPPTEPDASSAATPELAAAVLGVMAALGLIVLVPNLSVEYGALRAFQQTLLVVAPVMAAGMWLLLRLFRSRARALSVVVPVATLLLLTGVVSSAFGGNAGRLALANSGLYYERYLAPDSDMRAMSWVANANDNTGEQPKVITDRSFTLRIMATSDNPIEVVDRMYPTLLTHGSYVFVGSHLAETRRATVFYSGDRISYRYPMYDLDRHLDLVYSSGHSRVYR